LLTRQPPIFFDPNSEGPHLVIKSNSKKLYYEEKIAQVLEFNELNQQLVSNAD
jgi:hypothetical protein